MILVHLGLRVNPYHGLVVGAFLFLLSFYEDETRETSVALFKTGSPIVFEFSEDKPVLPVSNASLTYFSVAVMVLSTALKIWRLW